MKPLETTVILLLNLVIGLSDCGDVDISKVENVASDTSNGKKPEHILSYNEQEMLEHAMHEIEKRLKESPESLEYFNISHFTQLSPDPSNAGSKLHFLVWANFARRLYGCIDYEGCDTEPIANSRHEIEVQQGSDGSGTLVRFIPLYDDDDSRNNPRPEESHPNDREYSILNQVLPEIATRLGENTVVYRNISHFGLLSQNRNVEESGQRFWISADFERKICEDYRYDDFSGKNTQMGTEVIYEPIDNSQHEIEVQLYSNGSVALLKFVRSNDSFNDHTTNNPTDDPNHHPTNAPNIHPTPEELSMLAEVLHCIQHRLKWNRSVRYRNISNFKQLPENRQTGRHFSVVANFERPATCKLDRVPNCIYEPMPNSEYILEVQQNTTLRGDNEYIPMGTNIRSLELRK